MRVLEDDDVVALAKERGTAFEVCVTSNYQTGVVPALEAHPLGAMIKAGLNVTINTDDPSISRITLSQEYHTVCESLGLSIGTLKERIVAAARAVFLSNDERDQLVKQLTKELKL